MEALFPDTMAPGILDGLRGQLFPESREGEKWNRRLFPEESPKLEGEDFLTGDGKG